MKKHRLLNSLAPVWRRIHRADLKGTRYEKYAEPTSHVPKSKRRKPSKRQLIVQFAHWGCVNEPEIHYEQLRPIDGLKTSRKLPLRTDCSGFATLCYAWAGAPDPNGLGYDGQGYTGTLREHMKEISSHEIQPGDLVEYGCKSNPTGHHVAVITSVGKRTYATIETVSHGEEQGPFPITVAEEAQYQPDGLAGVVFLTLPGLN